LKENKSPITSKANEIIKPSLIKHKIHSKINKFSGISRDFGGFSAINSENSGGFYIKNKPVKSPGTSNSSNNSKGFLMNHGHK